MRAISKSRRNECGDEAKAKGKGSTPHPFENGADKSRISGIFASIAASSKRAGHDCRHAHTVRQLPEIKFKSGIDDVCAVPRSGRGDFSHSSGHSAGAE